jgi:peptide/nickel transport system substrate-binding protein
MTLNIRLLSLALLSVLAVALGACGGDDGDGAPAADEKRKGGTLTELAAGDVDYLDPGRTYYQFGLQVQYAISRPLYSFVPGKVEEPVPDLAAEMPEISEDKKTVTVRLRRGVRFGPPVSREVVAGDVKYAFERFFSANVGGPYPGHFSALVGAPSEPTRGVKSIRGIETPDDHTIVFRLKEPVGVTFASALVMPVTVPVPADYARKHDARNPSTYNRYVVATGPYMIENDGSGRLTGYQPGRRITLVRNPEWDPRTDHRPAYVDRIVIRTNATDTEIAARQVIRGKGMILDSNPPASVLRELVTRIKDQYVTLPAGGYRFFTLNTEVKPLDDINVRKAISAAFDREAARKARGGRYVGEIATHYLPPGMPGHEEAGGLKGPGVDFLSAENVRGDMELAAEYMRKAGYPSGRYTGNEELLVVGANADPGKAQAEVARAQLEKLGFKVRLRLVPQDALYTRWCLVPARKVAMCAGASWFRDFQDPQSMLEPVFKGSLINRDGPNNNMSMLNDPQVDAAMDLAAAAQGENRARAWAEVDRLIVERAAGIPWLWDTTTLVRSKDVAAEANPYTTLWDLSYTAIRAEE